MQCQRNNEVMHCSSQAILDSEYFSNHFHGRRWAWMCGADHKLSRSTIAHRIRFGRPLIVSCRESFATLMALRRKDSALFRSSMDLVRIYPDAKAEVIAIGQWISQALADGIKPSEIGIFVRARNQVDRARSAATAAGHEVLELTERGDDPGERISIGTMHLAKGLEFKAVVVMACDDDVLPLQSRIESAADEVELDDVYETERQLLYVACTRARDRLWVSGVSPASEFLNDLKLTAAN